MPSAYDTYAEGLFLSLTINMNKYVISPISYFFCAILVAFLVGWSVMFVEHSGGLHTFLFTGDIDVVVALLFWGGILFTLGNKLLFWVEKSEKQNWLTHLRQSALFYLVFIILGVPVLELVYNSFTVSSYSVGMGTIYYILPVLVASMGIIVNGVVTFIRHNKN